MKKDCRNIYKHNEQNNLIYSKVYVTEGYYSELLSHNESYTECYNKINPHDISYKSILKVWWICKKCNHSWDASINSRSQNGHGCPACSGMATTDNNRLTIFFPDLCKEWCYEINDKSPDTFAKCSGKKVHWKCLKCDYIWRAKISDRTAKGCGCPKCSKGKTSKQANSWLLYLNIPDDPSHREVDVIISGKKYYFDGYDPLTNTVYEYLGDYWHGNPLRFDPSKTNGKSKITFGELYKLTLLRNQIIIDAGYNLVIMWELDWKKIEKQ